MIKLITLLEMTADDFKKQLVSVGHTEKNGSQLTNGGDLDPKFLDIVSAFLTEWDGLVGKTSCRLKFTAGHDISHKTSNPKSAHNTGNGIDFTLDSSCHPKLIQLLTTYKSKYPGFSFLDEYTNPTKHSSGPHFHIQYGTGSATATTPATGTTTTTTTGGVDAKTMAKNFLGNVISNFGIGK
jgi:hypothetical protein